VRVATGGPAAWGAETDLAGPWVCPSQLHRILSRQAGHAGSRQQQQLTLVPEAEERPQGV
jgi:hypothetical protein